MGRMLSVSNRTSTIVGMVLASDGMLHQRDHEGAHHFGFVDVDRLAPYQPNTIPLMLGHDGEVAGEVLYLERCRAGHLFAVATTPLDELDHRQHFSAQLAGLVAELGSDHTMNDLIAHIGLVHSPGAVGLTPVRLLPHFDVRRHHSGLPADSSAYTRAVVARAHEHVVGRRRALHPAPMRVHDEVELTLGDYSQPPAPRARARASVEVEPVLLNGRQVPPWAAERQTYEEWMAAQPA